MLGAPLLDESLLPPPGLGEGELEPLPDAPPLESGDPSTWHHLRDSSSFPKNQFVLFIVVVIIVRVSRVPKSGIYVGNCNLW